MTQNNLEKNKSVTDWTELGKRRAISRKPGSCGSFGTEESLIFHANQLMWIAEHTIHFSSEKGYLLLIAFTMNFCSDLDYFCNNGRPEERHEVSNKEEIIRKLLGHVAICLEIEGFTSDMCGDCDECYHWDGPEKFYYQIRRSIQGAWDSDSHNLRGTLISKEEFNQRKKLASEILGVEVK